MFRIRRLGLIGCALFAYGLSMPAHAVEVDSVFSLGYDPGGNKLIDVVFTDGDSSSIRANEGIELSAGALFYHTSNLTWQTQATVGVKYMPVFAGNGRAEWITYPLEVIGFYNTNLLRFGAGLTYQLNPHIKTSGVIAPYSADLDHAFGYIAQIGFRAKKRQGISVDLRYTSIRYTGDIVLGGVLQPSSKVDGSTVGVRMSLMF